MVCYFQVWLKFTLLFGFCNNVAAKYNRKSILYLKKKHFGLLRASEMGIEWN